MMTNGYHTDGLFYPILTQIMDYFSCSPLNTSFYDEKNMKLLPEFDEMQQICDMRRHFNNTMTSQIGQHAAVGLHVLCVFFQQAGMENVR